MDERAFFKLSCGLYIVSSQYNGEEAGCIINTLQQVTNEPLQVSITINKNNYTQQVIEQARAFHVVVLDESADMDLIGTFGFQSSKDMNKFSGFSISRDIYQIPYVNQHVAAGFTCKVKHQMDVGTHIIYIAEVLEADVLGDTPAMTYAYYHQVKKGTTPKNASSYQKNVTTSGYRCTICGYIYEGDSLPEDFVCPVCHAPASVFEKV